jgi:molybdate transport system regulatory protein
VNENQIEVEIGGQLQLSRSGRKFLGSDRIALLEAIERLGSITRAAKEVGISYKSAWDAVDAMNNLAEQPLLIRATGGPHGGGSYLTQHGRDAVRLYRMLDKGYRRLLARMQSQVHDFDRLNELLKSITMKTSARNEFRGTVKSIHQGAVNSEVTIDAGDGVEIVASITNGAVDDLRLAPGREAVALIKSSFILLSPDPDVRISARNRLCGVVTDIVTGAVNSEVRIQLNGGRILNAVITNDSVTKLDLAEGCVCCALVKASHVLVAVND